MTAFFSEMWESIVGFLKLLIMAFSDIRITDIIDILVVAFFLYKAIGFIKETRAKILIKGLLALLVVWFFAQWLDLISIKWLLVKFFDYAIIAIVIIFNPELRNALERVGHSSFTNFGNLRSSEEIQKAKKSIDEVCKACMSMQEQRIGALIVFERLTPLGEIEATGTEVDATISEELVGNIFYPKSPLHDGGMIICGQRINAAGCILPLTSNNELSKELGTRHRAAVGMSESSDAVVVVVSEETGVISVCISGVITRNYNLMNLREKLYSELITVEEENKKNFITKFYSKIKNKSVNKSKNDSSSNENNE